ncbi:MAG: hypothetical protein AAF564_17780 [Bacteroidota bacterium]
MSRSSGEFILSVLTFGFLMAFLFVAAGSCNQRQNQQIKKSHLTMVNPTEAFQEWLNLVNIDHQDKIARFVLYRIPHLEWTPGENDEVDVLHSILEYENDPNAVTGKLISVTGILNFFLEERGSTEWWNAKIDSYLDVIQDDDESNEAKEDARERLTKATRNKMAWVETAASWKKLVRNVLSNKALRSWLRMHALKESL